MATTALSAPSTLWLSRTGAGPAHLRPRPPNAPPLHRRPTPPEAPPSPISPAHPRPTCTVAPPLTCVGQQAVALVPRHVINTRALVQTRVGCALVDVGLAVGAWRERDSKQSVCPSPGCWGRVPRQAPPGLGGDESALCRVSQSWSQPRPVCTLAGGASREGGVSGHAGWSWSSARPSPPGPAGQRGPGHSPLKPSRQVHT